MNFENKLRYLNFGFEGSLEIASIVVDDDDLPILRKYLPEVPLVRLTPFKISNLPSKNNLLQIKQTADQRQCLAQLQKNLLGF